MFLVSGWYQDDSTLNTQEKTSSEHVTLQSSTQNLRLM